MIGLRDSGAELKHREKGGDSNRAQQSGVGQQIKHTDWIFPRTGAGRGVAGGGTHL